MEDSEIKKVEAVDAAKKAAVKYLKYLAVELEGKFALHFVKGEFVLAAGDAKELYETMAVLARLGL